MKNINLFILTVVIIVMIFGSFAGGYHYGIHHQQSSMVCRYIMGGPSRMIRVQIVDPGNSGVGDLIGAMKRPEAILEMDGNMASLLMPGDIFSVRCEVNPGPDLRFTNCRIFPVVSRE